MSESLKDSVSIESMEATHPILRTKVVHEQYRIRLDREVIGYVAWAAGAPVCLIRKFSPIDKEAISQRVMELKSETTPLRVASVPDEVPAAALKTDRQREEESLSADDFD